MKVRSIIFVFIGCLLCVQIANAQYWTWLAHERRQRHQDYYDKFMEWWEDYYQQYLERRHEAEMEYIQAWNENMQQGILRLNTDPQIVGVTPVNGALLLNTTDITVPGRHEHDIRTAVL
jgi:hypothetical protein